MTQRTTNPSTNTTALITLLALVMNYILGKTVGLGLPASVRSATPTCSLLELKELDSLSVTVVVDNESDNMSSGGCVNVPGFHYLSERETKKKNKRNLNVPGLCLASHGLSLLLTGTYKDGASHTVLVDGGPDPDLWNANTKKLGIDIANIDAVVLSHYHWDHSAGLWGAVPSIAKHKQQKEKRPPPLVVDLHSAEIRQRGRPQSGGSVIPHRPDNPTADELNTIPGTKAVTSREPHTLYSDFFMSVATFPERMSTTKKEFPITFPGSMACGLQTRKSRMSAMSLVRSEGWEWWWFPLVPMRESSMFADVQQKAGGSDRLFGVIGGLHLGGKDVEPRIEQTIMDLKVLNPAVVLAGHCTGWRAKARLAMELPDRFQPLAVGATYHFGCC